jgi:PAS domain S-box-containing protein
MGCDGAPGTSGMTLQASRAIDQGRLAAIAEADRIAELRRYDVLDTPDEPAFDRIVHLAALLLDVPIALISLIDTDRQWFKARHGIEATEAPRAFAFCDHAIQGQEVMAVADAVKDSRFSDNPLVTGEPQIRFYAGAPLITPAGFVLGTICAIDRAPRELIARDSAILTALAAQVVHELEVRSALGELYREVAEGRRTERTLLGEGARLEALLNATGNAVVTADAGGKVASLNRVAEKMFGLEPGEALGWAADRLMTTGPHQAAGHSATSEGVGRRKNGQTFPIELSLANWTDPQGRPASGAVVRDVTERRRVEADQRRRDAAELAHEKLAALGRVAGGVAHELNNLLQPVIGLAQLELDELPDVRSAAQDDSHENLATIIDSGNQMRSVVRKILMFARKAKPELTPLDFPAALDRADAAVRNMLPPGILVDKVVGREAVGFANVNEAELIEAITNLAINAAHAMDGKGTLSVGVDRVVLSATLAMPLGLPHGDYFRVALSDCGHGMDAETKARIFEPFFTTKPIGEGAGLGLSMVYGVLRDWKGALNVDSAVGVGSTFTLYVPACDPR